MYVSVVHQGSLSFREEAFLTCLGQDSHARMTISLKQPVFVAVATTSPMRSLTSSAKLPAPALRQAQIIQLKRASRLRKNGFRDDVRAVGMTAMLPNDA